MNKNRCRTRPRENRSQPKNKIEIENVENSGRCKRIRFRGKCGFVAHPPTSSKTAERRDPPAKALHDELEAYENSAAKHQHLLISKTPRTPWELDIRKCKAPRDENHTPFLRNPLKWVAGPGK